MPAANRTSKLRLTAASRALGIRPVKQPVCRGQHPEGSTLKGHGRPRQIHVVSKTEAGRDRKRGHALGVHATFAGETEELIEELLDAVAWSERDAHSGGGATVRGPRVRVATRHNHGLTRAAHRLLTSATQQDAAFEDLELLLLGTMDVLGGQEGGGAQLEVQLGERTAGLFARPHERDALPGDRVLNHITDADHHRNVTEPARLVPRMLVSTPRKRYAGPRS